MRRLLRSESVYTTLGQEDRRLTKAEYWCVTVLNPEETGKSDTADRTWPCLQWKSWWAFWGFSSCIQLIQWGHFLPVRQQIATISEGFTNSLWCEVEAAQNGQRYIHRSGRVCRHSKNWISIYFEVNNSLEAAYKLCLGKTKPIICIRS